MEVSLVIPRKELVTLIQDRLKGALPQEKVDELAGDILSLEGEWEEMDISHEDMGYSVSVNCQDICWLADQVDHGAVFKLYRKKK